MIVSPVHNSKGRAIAHNQITGHGLLASSGLRKHPPGRPGVQQGCKLKAPLLCAACGAHARSVDLGWLVKTIGFGGSGPKAHSAIGYMGHGGSEAASGGQRPTLAT